MKKKYGDQGYQVDALGEVFRDNEVSGKREFFGNFESFKPSKPKRIGETPKSEPIDKEAAFIESETQEWDGEQPTASEQLALSNYTELSKDVSNAGTNKTSTRDKLNVGPARMGRIERENRARLGDERVDFLKQKQKDFKSMKRKDFAKKYPKSQTAKRLKIRK